MNGVLWKWTNYYNGWQPRWFVLKDGILSYFRSENEINSGSKGSINLSVCDLNVNTYDPSRFEIIIPGEQKYFLKASNTQERQRWIVALGTGKACHIEPEFQMKDRVGDYYLPLKEINFKESELRVYLELMNQQVGKIKTQLSEDNAPDITIINELTSTLNAACDTFLESLKDLVSIAVTSEAISLPDSPPTHIGSPIFSSLPIQNSTRGYHRHSIGSRHSNGSVSFELCTPSNFNKHLSQISETDNSVIIKSSRRETNFFVEMAHSFVDWSQQVDDTHPISTVDYTESMSSLLHFLNFFESQPIISLKNDIETYLKKLSLKYESDPKMFCDLGKLIVKNDDVQFESVTLILRSLHRVLSFVECFLALLLKWLHNFVNDLSGQIDENKLKCLIEEAFTLTMKDKLNWLDRGQFTIICKSLPSTSRFLCHLLFIDYSPNNIQTIKHYKINQLIIDLDHYSFSIIKVNKQMSHLFIKANIDL